MNWLGFGHPVRPPPHLYFITFLTGTQLLWQIDVTAIHQWKSRNEAKPLILRIRLSSRERQLHVYTHFSNWQWESPCNLQSDIACYKIINNTKYLFNKDPASLYSSAKGISLSTSRISVLAMSRVLQVLEIYHGQGKRSKGNGGRIIPCWKICLDGKPSTVFFSVCHNTTALPGCITLQLPWSYKTTFSNVGIFWCSRKILWLEFNTCS